MSSIHIISTLLLELMSAQGSLPYLRCLTFFDFKTPPHWAIVYGSYRVI